MPDTSKVIGWSQSGLIRPGSTQRVAVQADFGTGNAQTFTVQFGVKEATANVNLTVKLMATLRWSINGNTIIRQLSAISGMSISGLAEAVNVQVEDVSQQAFLNSATDDSVVTITVAPGTRASTQQPPFFENGVTNIPAGPQAIVVPVPQNVGIISVQIPIISQPTGTPAAEFSINAVMRNAGGGVLKAFDPRQIAWVPLAPGTIDILLVTSAAAPAFIATVTFGVDG